MSILDLVAPTVTFLFFAVPLTIWYKVSERKRKAREASMRRHPSYVGSE